MQIHKTYIVEFYENDFFRRQDMFGRYEVVAVSKEEAIERALVKVPKGQFVFVRINEIYSTFFELLCVPHGLKKPRERVNEQPEFAGTGPKVCPVETGVDVGGNGSDVARSPACPAPA